VQKNWKWEGTAWLKMNVLNLFSGMHVAANVVTSCWRLTSTHAPPPQTRKCQYTQTRNMITERHNLACSMIFKAISKTAPLGSCFVCMDIGSSEWSAMQNLQIPNTAETRIIPKWLFPSRFSGKNRFTSSRPDAVLLAPITTKTKKQQTSNGGGVFL
jgi:hypothetical protein